MVAAVNGYCLGGGFKLLLATDIRLAAEHATFAVPEVTRGFLPGNGATLRMTANLGYARAMEMLLTGTVIDAVRACDWGLVNQVVPADRLLDEATAVARSIARNAPLAVQATKELAVRSQSMDQAQGIRLEQLLLVGLYRTEDVAEGVAAFRERREPDFRGR